MDNKELLFTINIYLDKDTNEFVPEFRKTSGADRYHRRDQVGIINACALAVQRQIRTTPDNNN